MSRVVFFHGLESAVDANLIPTGKKARFLQEHYGATLVGLDTRVAIARKAYCIANRQPWLSDTGAVEAAFSAPMTNARAAIQPDTKIIVASSFGGAVLMKLLVEDGWRGGCVFLAGAAVKLTEHRIIPAGCPSILIHGWSDDVVDAADSQLLAQSSLSWAQHWSVNDGHRLPTVLADGTLHAAMRVIEQALTRT